mmetsp:Transcript_8750/g.28075  ORF Transcript_8750/g.28075 Transcript_8750/m.28075 type:complete len:243 (-) Transcript_8750:89-817(-)
MPPRVRLHAELVGDAARAARRDGRGLRANSGGQRGSLAIRAGGGAAAALFARTRRDCQERGLLPLLPRARPPCDGVALALGRAALAGARADLAVLPRWLAARLPGSVRAAAGRAGAPAPVLQTPGLAAAARLAGHQRQLGANFLGGRARDLARGAAHHNLAVRPARPLRAQGAHPIVARHPHARPRHREQERFCAPAGGRGRRVARVEHRRSRRSPDSGSSSKRRTSGRRFLSSIVTLPTQS